MGQEPEEDAALHRSKPTWVRVYPWVLLVLGVVCMVVSVILAGGFDGEAEGVFGLTQVFFGIFGVGYAASVAFLAWRSSASRKQAVALTSHALATGLFVVVVLMTSWAVTVSFKTQQRSRAYSDRQEQFKRAAGAVHPRQATQTPFRYTVFQSAQPDPKRDASQRQEP